MVNNSKPTNRSIGGNVSSVKSGSARQVGSSRCMKIGSIYHNTGKDSAYSWHNGNGFISNKRK